MSEHEYQPDDLRAAEYVLGTLPPEERAAVDNALAHGDQRLAAAIAWWEERLGRLAYALEPVDPPSELWSRIAAGVQFQRSPDRTSAARPAARRWWPTLAAAASAAVIAVAATLYLDLTQQPAPTPSAPSYASVIRDQSSGAGWLVTASERTRVLEVTALADYPTPAGKSLELWLLPPEKKPISLGLLPEHGHHRRELPPEAAALFSKSAKVAVSLEPEGGSPTGQPTGEVLWVEPLTGRTG